MYSRGAHSSKVASFTWANSQSEAICTPLLPVDASAFSLLQYKRIGVSKNKINTCYNDGCPNQSLVSRPICITLLNLKQEICVDQGHGTLIHTPYAFGSPFAITSAAVSGGVSCCCRCELAFDSCAAEALPLSLFTIRA